MTGAISDFERLLDDIEEEAREEGPEAIRDLRALQLKYRLINQIIKRRRALGWTQQDLAAHSGIGQAEISRIERGRKSPTIDTYSRLASALEISAEGIDAVTRRPHSRRARQARTRAPA